MKKCRMCGAVQSDKRGVCIDCGALLGKPMSEEEEAAVNEAVSEQIDSSGERTEFFYTPIALRVLGIISVIAVVVLGIFITVTANENKNLKIEMTEKANALGVTIQDAGTLVFSDGSVEMDVIDGYVDKINALEHRGLLMFLSMVLLIVPAVTFLFPSALWALETWTWRRVYSIDAEPTDLWLTIIRVVGFFCLALGAGMLLTLL